MSARNHVRTGKSTRTPSPIPTLQLKPIRSESLDRAEEYLVDGYALAGKAASALFNAWSNRIVTAPERIGVAFNSTYDELAAMLAERYPNENDPARRLLWQLQEDHGSALVEYEDRAFFVAFGAAQGIVRGGR